MSPPASFLTKLFSLEGRVALCTGASSGIGRHMAETLARAGARTVLLARRADTIAAIAQRLADEGAEAAAVDADVNDLDGLPLVYSRAAEPFGSPDILINAAGVNFREKPEEITIDSWRSTIDLNLSVPFFLARLCVPAMKERGMGNIINIASLQSFRAFENGAAYGASKGGVAQLTRAMAEAWSRDGIVANAILPGFFSTELTQAVFADGDLAGHHAAQTAIGRNGEMADLEGATVFLSSRAAAYVTGQLLPIDGGYTAK